MLPMAKSFLWEIEKQKIWVKILKLEKFPKTAIGVHYNYPRDERAYQTRCALYSGTDQEKYSIILMG